jgi:hypothetical protein
MLPFSPSPQAQAKDPSPYAALLKSLPAAAADGTPVQNIYGTTCITDQVLRPSNPSELIQAIVLLNGMGTPYSLRPTHRYIGVSNEREPTAGDRRSEL